MKYREAIVISATATIFAIAAYVLAHDSAPVWVAALATGTASSLGAWAAMTFLKRQQ